LDLWKKKIFAHLLHLFFIFVYQTPGMWMAMERVKMLKYRGVHHPSMTSWAVTTHISTLNTAVQNQAQVTGYLFFFCLNQAKLTRANLIFLVVLRTCMITIDDVMLVIPTAYETENFYSQGNGHEYHLRASRFGPWQVIGHEILQIVESEIWYSWFFFGFF